MEHKLMKIKKVVGVGKMEQKKRVNKNCKFQ